MTKEGGRRVCFPASMGATVFAGMRWCCDSVACATVDPNFESRSSALARAHALATRTRRAAHLYLVHARVHALAHGARTRAHSVTQAKSAQRADTHWAHALVRAHTLTYMREPAPPSSAVRVEVLRAQVEAAVLGTI